MENAPLAIVIPVFNRPSSLKRLLAALVSAVYPKNTNVPLIFAFDQSSDQGFCPHTSALIDAFKWNRGTKTILKAPHPLGLKDNLLRCGDLTQEHLGVIVLEDDLWVTPHFYKAALKLFDAYHEHPRIAAISLYSFRYNEHAGRSFTPLADPNDTYFIQTSSSWGQIWWKAAWAPFRDFLNTADSYPQPVLPVDILDWPNSWKKEHIRYLVTRDLYSVVPRVSHTTNMGTPGKNHVGLPHLLQADLATGVLLDHLGSIEDSKAIYDAFFEPHSSTLVSLFPQLPTPLESDCYGIKPLISLSGKRCISARDAYPFVERYAHHLRPDILNLNLPDPEGFFVQAQGEHLMEMTTSRHQTLFEKDYPNFSGRDGLKHSLAKLSKRLFKH